MARFMNDACPSSTAEVVGLSVIEAEARLRAVGENRIQTATSKHVLVQLLARFRNPLVLVLLAAAIVSAATGEAASALIIALIVTISVVLDFVQEFRAGQAAERLAARVAVRATVLRDGAPCRVPATAVVPGDVLLLAAGDLIAADAVLIEAHDFFVNQSQLTGEAFPVERQAAVPPLAEDAPLDTDRTDAVFMGGSVVSGRARALVRRTGAATAIGQIAGALGRDPPATAFERGTRQFGFLIMRLTFALVLFVLLINAAFQRPLIDSFLFAVALAVGLTPELLPMVVSVTLTRGAQRLAAAKVVVKRLSAIQDLGAMDVLCTDKTGTLTEASIRLEQHTDGSGRTSRRVLELVYLNSHFETGVRSALDDAIEQHGGVDVSGWVKLDEVPFDFERRRVSVLIERDGVRQLVVKGAPEDVLRLCTHVEEGGVVQPLDAAAHARLQATYERLSDAGLRLLGVAWREVPREHAHAVVGDESELVFAGYAAFLDPPKASAAGALAALARDGVRVKVITGDNERVARHVCTQIGFAVQGVLTGAQLDALNDEALRARMTKVNLVCRANPAQKNRVLLALKARGHVVGFLGDGINDAPALHSADVGISVDGAVDVAKQAAALILMERDLGVLHAGIREGRRTFGNVMKYIMMATSSNFGNMFSMAAATLVLPFLPLLPLQILLNNLLYDVSELALPLDRVDDEDLARPRHWDMAFIRNFMLSVGPLSSLFDFLTFYLLLHVLSAGEVLFRTGWFVESIATQVLVIFVIRTRRSPWASRPHPALLALALAVVAVAMALPFTPLAPALGFVPLPGEYFLLLAVLLPAYLLVVEAGKRLFYARFAAHRRGGGRRRGSAVAGTPAK